MAAEFNGSDAAVDGTRRFVGRIVENAESCNRVLRTSLRELDPGAVRVLVGDKTCAIFSLKE